MLSAHVALLGLCSSCSRLYRFCPILLELFEDDNSSLCCPNIIAETYVSAIHQLYTTKVLCKNKIVSPGIVRGGAAAS